jgi:hypothetical protein
MLNIGLSEVPTKREANIGQWLALRNLGLVPVASPESFEWPGRFLGLKRGSSTWAVFFGVPPGIVYDPMADLDGKKEVAVEAAFVLAKHDLQRGTQPGSGTRSVGTVELIAVVAEAEAPMRAVSAAEAVEGRACWAIATSVKLGPSRTRTDAATISPWWRLKRWRSCQPKVSSWRRSRHGVTSS